MPPPLLLLLLLLSPTAAVRAALSRLLSAGAPASAYSRASAVKFWACDVSAGAGVHLFFPSMYHQFTSGGAPYGAKNDGLLDIRLVVSRDGVNLSYAPAANGRAPYVALGPNSCGAAAHAPAVHHGW